MYPCVRVLVSPPRWFRENVPFVAYTQPLNRKVSKGSLRETRTQSKTKVGRKTGPLHGTCRVPGKDHGREVKRRIWKNWDSFDRQVFKVSIHIFYDASQHTIHSTVFAWSFLLEISESLQAEQYSAPILCLYSKALHIL